MSGTAKRNRLMPWTIGLLIIVAAVAYAGWEISVNGCGAPAVTLVIAFAAMPAVYLVLMYLTLTSQD